LPLHSRRLGWEATTDLLREIALQNKKSLLLATLLVSVFAFQSAQAHAAKDSSSPCASFINSDFPKAVLSNGSVQAVVYLPDTEKGYYRSTRFDWSGVVPCLTYKGHTYFGIWFKHYDPLINDAIAGPVEEFRSSDGFSSINYNEAKPGELFIKPGVGVLRKVDNSPYNFGFRYPIVDLGKWKVRVKKDQVTFSQTLQSPLGYAYIYEKTLKLDKHQPILTLEHHPRIRVPRRSIPRSTTMTSSCSTVFRRALEWRFILPLSRRQKSLGNRAQRLMAKTLSICRSWVLGQDKLLPAF
jgi:hypothetical protein